ncbi:MAG TPA: hypothetical protein VJ343_00195 [archaeon]|nr:hypothetical protein [archaeon]
MLIRKNHSREKKNSETCTVWEYPLGSKNLGFAIALINGRYPEDGAALNEVCEVVYYVISGSGIISCDGKPYKLEEGDCFKIEVGNKYWVEGKNLLIAIPTGPAWYAEQFKHVKE